MRLITFRLKEGKQEAHVGVELADGKGIVDLNVALEKPDLTMKKFLAMGE